MELEGMDGMGRKMCRGNMEMKGMIGSGRNCWKWKELLTLEGWTDGDPLDGFSSCSCGWF